MGSDALFAPYEPRPQIGQRPTLPRALEIRSARGDDLPGVARLIVARDGGEHARHLDRLAMQLGRGEESEQIVVASIDNEIVGYGRSTHFEPPEQSPPDTAPSGWYLAGLIVAPQHRRAGIGLALTQHRMEQLSLRTRSVSCFASALNQATIDLHAKLGFVELTRRFIFPGVTFTGGAGILFRADLRRFRPNARG